MTQIATVERILDDTHAEISVPRKSACGHDCEECAGCGVSGAAVHAKAANPIDAKPGQKVVIVEDLVSTGKSSLKAAQALRNAGAEVVGMVAIFSYEFPIAAEAFEKEGVKLLTISNYTSMIKAAVATNYIKEEDVECLQQWREDPAVWTPRNVDVD